MKRTIIISESQLHLIREYENQEILHDDFTRKVRDFLEELRVHPNHPSFDAFFERNNISQKDLINKMIDLDIITLDTDTFSEPENANGKKHSMHSRRYTIHGKNYSQNMDKLYDSYFTKDHKRKQSINEEGEAGGFAGGDGALGCSNAAIGDSDMMQGAIKGNGFNKKVIRKPGYNSQRKKKTGDVTKQSSNVNMAPAMDRTPGGMCCQRIK